MITERTLTREQYALADTVLDLWYDGWLTDHERDSFLDNIHLGIIAQKIEARVKIRDLEASKPPS